MKADAVRRKLRQLGGELARKRIPFAQKLAGDANALIKSRVINRGETADGGIFGIYAKASQRYREQNNLTETPYPKINFKDTSRMWTNTRPQYNRGESSSERAVFNVGPDQPAEVDKMRKNVKRFGPIMAVSQSELVILRKTVEKRYSKILQKYFS